MTYFLDFDRTLFDTSAFIAYVIKRDSLQHLLTLSEADMAVELNTLTKGGKLSFSEGELFRFMYPDAVEFLQKKLSECVVVTAGNIELQKAKLENVFQPPYALPLFYTRDEEKGPFLKRMKDSYVAPYVFIDDKPSQLDSVQEFCPDVTSYEIQRGQWSPSGRYPLLSSFSELP